MQKKSHLHVFLVLLMLMLSSVGCKAKDANVEKCELADLQRCTSCVALDKTLDMNQPDAGEYYRGAYWNGLYTAFKLNCLKTGKQLLDSGANPNLGGTSGSFPASLVSAWPHQDEKINQQWIKLISQFKVDVHWKNPYTDLSADTIIQDELIKVDYPKLWKALSKSGKEN